MPSALPTQEGYVTVTGGRIWYQIIGAGDATPLLTLHGGPGWPHDSLEPLAALADVRPIIFYDQLGCGKSDRPDDSSLWHIDRFVEEVELLRQMLSLERMSLLGHSWGTMLAVDYALAQPARIEKLVLSSPALSIPRWIADASHYVSALPDEMREAVEQGRTEDEVYQAAEKEFSHRHFCRLDPRPEAMQRAGQGFSAQVYQTMWGPNEFVASGNLKDYDRTDRLGDINASTLFLCGRYDEATPATTAYYSGLMPNSSLIVFEQSAHVPQFEEETSYIQAVRDFLNGG